MSGDLLLWCGPVYGPGSSPYAAGDVGNVVWDVPTKIVTISGDGSSYFSSLASQWTDSDGRILPTLLRAYKLDAGDYDQIAVAGFSAAHGLLNPLLGADGDGIDAAVLLDSCFETPGSPPKSGYASFAARAAAGDRLMVFTGSAGQNAPPLPPTTKGFECAMHAAQAGADAAGVAFPQVSAPSGVPTPDCGAYSAGGLWFLSYCNSRHDQLINQQAVAVLQTFLAPYLASAQRGATPGHHGSLGWNVPTWLKWTAGALLIGAAAAGGVALARRAA